jgi:hypothetical protein
MAADESITTLARVKEYMGITVSTYDTVLTTLLNTATKWVKDYCNRPLGWATQAVVEYATPNDADTIVLKCDPVTAISAIYIVKNAATAYTFTTPEYEWTEGGVVRLTGNAVAGWNDWRWGTFPIGAYVFDKPSFGMGIACVKVEYTGGYATIPEDLQQAVVEIVKGLYQQRTEDTTIESEKLGDYSYKRTAGGIRAVFDDVAWMYLSRYQRGATLS